MEMNKAPGGEYISALHRYHFFLLIGFPALGFVVFVEPKGPRILEKGKMR